MQLTRLIPASVLRRIRAVRAAFRMRRVAHADVRSVFRDIYRDATWGSVGDGYFSGVGSLDVNSREYIAYVNRFLAGHAVTEIVDCGCGDFRVARQFDLAHRRYIGVDVVNELIQRNREAFGTPNIEFRALDLIEDQLPHGELCLIRQVLQHLSNEAILHVLAKTDQYRYVLITDEQLRAAAHCNRDINSFSGTRNDVGSTLLLERAPFNRKVQVVLETPSAHRRDTYFRTILITNSPS